jgi:prepilin-type N-terminal cleavage/methylation domain-containing protein
VRNTRAGFTLIELMIVVAIIGILAAIAIPKFAELIRKSGEGSSKGNLGALRSALSIYYGDMEGQFPGSLTGLTVSGKYLASIPKAKAPNYHSDSSVSRVLPGGCVIVNWDTDDFNSGGWVYCDAPADPGFGNAIINCTHTDTKGSVWSSY